MDINIGNDIRITNPSEEIKEFCDTHLTLANPDYAKKLRMGLWLGNTPKTLYLYEKDGDTLVLPYGCFYTILPWIDGHPYHLHFRKPIHIDYGDSVPLFDYQEEAVEHMMTYVNGILESPAGSGKTQMGIALTQKLGRRTLWLTHTKDLLSQSMHRAEMYMDKDLIGTITDGEVNVGKGITFATVQTMTHLNLNNFRDTWDVIIVDEVHRVSGTPTSARMFYKVISSLRARYKYGLSATIHRGDGLLESTFAVIGKVRHKVPREAVGERIVPVKIKPCYTNFQVTDECLNRDGTLNFTYLITQITYDDKRNSGIIGAMMSNSAQSSLILSNRVEHLKRLREMLPYEMQQKAAVIDGKMQSKKGRADREQAIEDMRTGKLKYLFATYNLAKEGLDIPCLSRLYLTTPVKDKAVVEQSIGRIARNCEGKEEPVCYDFVDYKVRFLNNSYRKRVSTYKRIGCTFVEGDSNG